eukprot:scaffold3424_cov230-Isochrysis_galbana.AAC.1
MALWGLTLSRMPAEYCMSVASILPPLPPVICAQGGRKAGFAFCGLRASGEVIGAVPGMGRSGRRSRVGVEHGRVSHLWPLDTLRWHALTCSGTPPLDGR